MHRLSMIPTLLCRLSYPNNHHMVVDMACPRLDNSSPAYGNITITDVAAWPVMMTPLLSLFGSQSLLRRVCYCYQKRYCNRLKTN